MATVVFVLIVATYVVNSIVGRSETAWWRDPGSQLREGGALSVEGPPEQPPTGKRKALPPGTVASVSDGHAIRAHRASGLGSWDAVADRGLVTEVLPRIVPAGVVSRRPTPDHDRETELIARVPPPGARR